LQQGGEHVHDTGISEEITTLRERIEAAEAAIAGFKSRVSARPNASDQSSAEEAELRELTESRDLMVSRLSRLESCKRIPEG